MSVLTVLIGFLNGLITDYIWRIKSFFKRFLCRLSVCLFLISVRFSVFGKWFELETERRLPTKNRQRPPREMSIASNSKSPK